MKMKKVSSMLLVIALVLVCSIGTCFAGTLPEDSENTVPVYLTIDGDLTLDFTISEKITMYGEATTDVVNVSDLFITNNGTMGQIELKKLELSLEDGWSIEDSQNDFVNMASNSKKIGLVSDGHDFSDGAKIYANDELLVDVSSTRTVSFDGKTCPTTTEISNTKVASVIATIAIN